MIIQYCKQENEYFCGPAIVQMLYPKASQNALAYLMKTNSLSGTSHKNIKLMLEEFNFKCIEKIGFDELQKSINNKEAVTLVCYLEPFEKNGHFAFIKSININKIELIDPYYGENYKITREYFNINWKGEETPTHWLMEIGHFK
jgi:ABC-type bacteriocin/lantibiotic exporter with double-glycine peptidase domain